MLEMSKNSFTQSNRPEDFNKEIPEVTIARLMGHTTTQLIGRCARQTTVDLMNQYKSPIDN